MKFSTIIFDNSFYEYFEKDDESDDGVVVFESKKKGWTLPLFPGVL